MRDPIDFDAIPECARTETCEVSPFETCAATGEKYVPGESCAVLFLANVRGGPGYPYTPGRAKTYQGGPLATFMAHGAGRYQREMTGRAYRVAFFPRGLPVSRA